MRALVPGALLVMLVSPAWGQPVTNDELVQALKERDRVIAALEKRVEALEGGRISATPAARNSAPPASTDASVDADSSNKDDVALQALSRTLVARGALVLPEWSMEVAPGISYTHNQTEGLVVVPTPDGFTTVDSQRLRDDSVKASLTARVGLPWNSEFEIRVPYSWMQESVSLGDGTHSVETKSRIGDIETELSHQLLREGNWRPDLLGAVFARFPTGKDPFRSTVPNLASGFGTYELGGRLTALKSADPIVFFTTVEYAHDFAADEPIGHVQLGDTFKVDLGGVLAVSPRTSLTADFVQQFMGRTKIGGSVIPGSDRVASTMQLGADYVLGPKVLLDVSLGIGITSDAPDYTLLFSVPVRF
jgi:hypothetical protein